MFVFFLQLCSISFSSSLLAISANYRESHPVKRIVRILNFRRENWTRRLAFAISFTPPPPPPSLIRILFRSHVLRGFLPVFALVTKDKPRTGDSGVSHDFCTRGSYTGLRNRVGLMLFAVVWTLRVVRRWGDDSPIDDNAFQRLNLSIVSSVLRQSTEGKRKRVGEGGS